jgi:tetratricopeptide (TPR) repeat protein
VLPQVTVVRQSKLPIFIVCSLVALTANIVFVCPGFAQSYNMPYRTGLAYYGAGNFKQAFEQFNQLLAKDPNDARLHYYAGNCLIKLGRIKEAISDYRACVMLGTDSEAAVLSKQALAVWDKPVGKDASVAAANAQPKGGFGAAGAAASFASGSPAVASSSSGILPGRQPPVIIDVQASERARMIADNTTLQLKNLTENYKRWSKIDSDKLAADIKSVPKRFEVDGKYVPNPDYDTIVSGLKQDAENKANSMQSEYQRRVREISEDSKKRQETIIAEGANVKAMYARDSGFSRMMPHGSNLYVRNYLNQSGMDDSPELVQSQRQPLPPALSAVAQPLRFGRQGPGKVLPPLR